MRKDQLRVLKETIIGLRYKKKKPTFDHKRVIRKFKRVITMSEKTTKSDDEWQKVLTKEQFQICRKKGTEKAFTGKYWDCHERGNYHCACCDSPLFSSIT